MKYLIFDTETGGLDYEKSALLTVGAILLDDNLQEVSTAYALLKNENEKEINEKALEVNGLKEGQFENAISSEHFKILWNWYLLPQADVLIGHNIAFDISFMENNGYDTISKTLDTMHLSWDIWGRDEDGKLKSAKLSTVYARIGLEAANAHNALYDCVMTADLLRWAVENEKIELPLPSYPLVKDYYSKRAFGYKELGAKGLLDNSEEV